MTNRSTKNIKINLIILLELSKLKICMKIEELKFLKNDKIKVKIFCIRIQYNM